MCSKFSMMLQKLTIVGRINCLINQIAETPKHKLQPEEFFYFKAIVQDLCQHNFYLTLSIYWYEIKTICKLDHNFLKLNQTSNLFIKSHYKSNLKENQLFMKQDLIA